jgi:sRNA-binding protein
MTESITAQADIAPTTTPAAPKRPHHRPSTGSRNRRPAPKPAFEHKDPVLQQLASLYPALFGAVARPLKRGIFQDLMAAHADVLNKETLKTALAMYTRSSRYLSAMASGQPRFDLQGQSVEPVAPEHVYHALTEVFRRRQSRSEENLQEALARRILQAFEASGMTREAYAERMQSKDEAANAALALAMGQVATRHAKDEALLRAFEASGQTLEAFADMYGMPQHVVALTLARARPATTVTSPSA